MAATVLASSSVKRVHTVRSRSRHPSSSFSSSPASRGAKVRIFGALGAAATAVWESEIIFKVPRGAVQTEFLALVDERRKAMATFPGFIECVAEELGEEKWAYKTSWEEKEKWEHYMWSNVARSSQMPIGIWQYPLSGKDKGILEPYVPILRLE